MDQKNSTPTPLEPITYDPHDPILTGLRLGNAIWRAVNSPPLNERIVPSPLPGSRCLTLVKGGR